MKDTIKLFIIYILIVLVVSAYSIILYRMFHPIKPEITPQTLPTPRSEFRDTKTPAVEPRGIIDDIKG